MSDWTFLFELRWYHGTQFVQRFHAWDTPDGLLWEMAWPLFELQTFSRRLLLARKGLAR